MEGKDTAPIAKLSACALLNSLGKHRDAVPYAQSTCALLETQWERAQVCMTPQRRTTRLCKRGAVQA